MTKRKLQDDKSAFLVYESWFTSAAPLDDKTYRLFWECVKDTHVYLTTGKAFDYQAKYGAFRDLAFLMPNVIPALCVSESNYFKAHDGGNKRAGDLARDPETAAIAAARSGYYSELSEALRSSMLTFEELQSMKGDSPSFSESRGIPSIEERYNALSADLQGTAKEAAELRQSCDNGIYCHECAGLCRVTEDNGICSFKLIKCDKCGKEYRVDRNTGEMRLV